MRIQMRAVVAAVVSGVALIVVGLIIGRPTVGIEGAYFNQSPGARAAGTFFQTGTGLFDPSDGNIWIGAGLGMLLLTAAIVVIARRGLAA